MGTTMEYFSFAVFSFCLMVAVINLIRTWQSIRWIAANQAVPEEAADHVEFVILVPLLREQVVVPKLIERLSALQYSWERIRIVLITTAREDSDSNPTTREVLADVLRKRSDRRFLHLHCDDETDHCKADQLNYALRRLELHGERRHDLFIGVYDADSSPDPRILRYVAWRIQADANATAFQQVPLYLQNTHRISRTPRGLYLLARPLHNALFALTIEVPEMRIQTTTLLKPKGSLSRVFGGWLSHALGHGQFFRSDVLTELGGFMPPSCDTQFGHALALAGVPLRPVPLLDIGQTPESVRVLLRQGVVWFNSMNTFGATKRHVDRLAPVNYCRLTAWWMMARLVHSNLAWAFYPPIFLACAVWACVAGHWPLLAYAAVAWLAYLIPVALIMKRFDLWRRIAEPFEPIQPFSRATKLGILLMYGVEKLGASLSPFWWFLGKARQWAFGTPIILAKTERALGVAAAIEREHENPLSPLGERGRGEGVSSRQVRS